MDLKAILNGGASPIPTGPAKANGKSGAEEKGESIMGEEAVDLLEQMLVYDAAGRISGES
jgi:hypothetical protein